ncbi:MAG TPA: acyl-phosphate glycerol 3-phosphate acyltransferase [Desulfotomaculum sp.]|nr:MAG: acyl-phosphate glycerol 3-phosphate acyltransferase [Desulfotomaculum sp. BICA1-6]HBX24316.1 acyl-phosphate glycerol 3-phosphate acyltransferase [Desulfotomaculum sp.]
MDTFLAVVISYLIGSIPFGYLLARLKGIDIMEHGSGNIGATNVWRNMGPVPGLAVLLLDMGKGAAAVLIGKSLGGIETELLAAIAAICGHSWSVFLRFKGGKMIATGGGVVLAMSPILVLVGFVVWITTVAVTRYVSLGSILAAVSIPVTMAIIKMSPWHITFGAAMAVLAVYKHRANISRILDGTEFKVTKGGRK